jgi:hypothetical protein
MKSNFIFLLGLATASTACVNFELPDDGTADIECVGEGCVHELSGELILFVNARLSDESSSFQTNVELASPGTFLGNALYAYDPTRECDDGGNACRVVKLGYLQLDDSLGELSVGDNSLRRFTIIDIAWHPEHGLWAVTYDPFNDEWSISELTVPELGRTDNRIGVERWVLKPGAADSPDTDPCYWFSAVTGLGFAGDELLLGVRGLGSLGLITDGSLFRIDRSVFEQGHCVQPSDITQDPLYYACDVVCEHWCTFGDRIGVAGDVIEDHAGVGASAWLRSESADVMPLEHNELSTCVAPEPGEVATGVLDSVGLDDVMRGNEIDALARVGGKLYGMTVLGKVYEIDEQAGSVTEIDDLAGLFPDQGLRLRGATEIVIPAAP